MGPDIIPDHVMVEHNFATENRHKLRPDALIVEEKSRGKKRNSRGQHAPPYKGQRGKAFILEVGYTMETRYTDKFEEKHEQHRTLVKLLEASGFEPVVCPIILGSTGGIFKSSQEALLELGVPPAAIQKLNRKLHVHSINSMHGIIKLRRVKEQNHNPSYPRKKKPPDKT